MDDLVTVDRREYNLLVKIAGEYSTRLSRLETLIGSCANYNDNLKINDVCKLLNISRTQLARLDKEGLPRHYVGKSPRYSLQDILTFNYNRSQNGETNRQRVRENKGGHRTISLVI